MPKRKSFKEKKKAVIKIDKSYRELRQRLNGDMFLSDGEKEDRRKAFLRIHVGIVDEFVSDPAFRESALVTTKDYASYSTILDEMEQELPESRIGVLRQQAPDDLARPEDLIEEGGERSGSVGEGSSDSGDSVGAESKIRSSIREDSRIRIDEEEEEEEERTSFGELVHRNITVSDESVELGAKNQGLAGLNRGLTNPQVNGLRDIGAWMYRNAKAGLSADKTLFVDALMTRSAREKLLMYYLVENDKMHNPGLEHARDSQRYTPDLARFKDKMIKTKWKFWSRISGNKYKWDKLSDAAVYAQQVRPVLAAMGMVLASENGGGAPSSSVSGGAPVRVPRIRDEEEESDRGSSTVSADRDASVRDREGGRTISLAGGPTTTTTSHEDVQEVQNNIGRLLMRLSRQAQPLLRHDFEGDHIFLSQELIAQAAQVQATIDELEGYLGRLETPASPTTFKDVVDVIGEITRPTQKALGIVTKGLKLDPSEAVQNFAGDVKGLGVPSAGLSLLSGVLGIVNILYSGANLVKGWNASQASDIIKSLTSITSSLGGLGMSGLGSAMSIGKMVGDAWMKNDPVLNALGGLGIVTGAVSMLTGGIGYHSADKRSKESKEVLDEVKGMRFDPQDEKRKQKFQMLYNVASANRLRQEERGKADAATQMAQGVLTGLAGVASLAAFTGVGGVLSIIFSSASLIITFSQMVADYKMKKVERKQLIYNYLGIGRLYEDMRRENPAIARQKKEDVLERLARQAEATLGFPSDEKFFAHIMFLYANQLFDAAFKGPDGQFLPPPYDAPARAEEAEEEEEGSESAEESESASEGASSDGGGSEASEDGESPQQVRDRENEERKLFLRMIHSLGLAVEWDANNRPNVGVEAIYKKLMS